MIEASTVERRAGTPALLHGPWPEATSVSVRVVGLFTPTAPVTVVLGSAQPLVQPEFHEVAVARRSSGGGAVLIAPHAQVWVDVWLPRTDPLWDDDVVRSSFWLGRAWRDALGAEGVADLEVHEGRLVRNSSSDVVCFAGLGPGELRWRGRKLVGISQRRNKLGARFQSVSPLDPLDMSLLELLELDPEVRRHMESTLARETTCLTEATGADAHADKAGLLGRVEESLVRSISAAGK